ncbi:DegT/DnrJ/EryC1/StrS family aminotransferase [Anaerococcus porci]|uniref:Orn/Lys/Arg family decarboxylase n=1 Tax=Anaerococcus porci TaxID=2652269 RepID=UPI002A74CBBF|nr:DegT/DnrJ/EryC1/StrS family aminotransferase [Anaerococcus porci]MDY3006994.1 DegT/DnrJ/EryC1/StrS family aminotransferase [Anaerococcus porci]
MLIDKLDQYIEDNYYSFAMPGHKRNKNILNKALPYDRDITEIRGFDNLNDPKTIFKDMEDKLKEIYKSFDFIISTNGSTCGILSSIRTLTRKNKNILVQRNSHKSVYNAIEIFNLDADFIDLLIDCDIAYDIDYDDLENKLKNKDYSAIVLTSPSYEGFMLNLKRIRKISKNTKIILDMAHGSHLILDKLYDELDFDIAITSFHKNLSALTPAGGVIINNKSIDKKEVRRNMAIFQTSSPSYIICQSIDDMIDNFQKFYMLYNSLNENLDDLYNIKLSNLKFINNKNKDKSKILISCKNTNINGNDFSNFLYKKKIEVEMVSYSYVLLLSSIFNQKKDFNKLKQTIINMDKNLSYKKDSFDFSYKIPKRALSINDALRRKKKIVDFNNADKKISGSFIYAYPPGIPLIVPGEIFDIDIISNIKNLLEQSVQLNIEKGGFIILD